MPSTSPQDSVSRPTAPSRRLVPMVIGIALAVFVGYRLLVFLDELFSFAGKWEGRVRSAVSSPDARYVAEVSDWNGGATTGLETRVALRPHSARDTVTGVTRSEGTVAILLGDPPVTVRWQGAQHLIISGPTNTFKERQASWRDVQITYQTPK